MPKHECQHASGSSWSSRASTARARVAAPGVGGRRQVGRSGRVQHQHLGPELGWLLASLVGRSPNDLHYLMLDPATSLREATRTPGRSLGRCQAPER